MTTLLERVIRAHRCRSTHHFIALDALSLIGGERGEMWKSLFLVHHEHLLKGAKAPDAEFKDFKNHVLHVTEGDWGGARGKAGEWYARSVELLSRKRWSEAAYALGVLSHYYADPIQPFHTGQTEAEGVIHRAVEWSIAKSRPEIDARIARTGYPKVEVPDGLGFVSDMVKQGALRSNRHYYMFLDHYDIDAGVSDPPTGLDETMRAAIADLIAYATSGFAAIITKAVEEAGTVPPKVHLTLQGYIETLDIPLRWITSKLEDMADRRQVEKMYKEYQNTGKVIKSLPEDDKVIREKHAKEVRRVSLKALNAEPITPLGTKRDGVIPQVLAAADAPETEDILSLTEVVDPVREDMPADFVEAEFAPIEPEAEAAAQPDAELLEEDARPDALDADDIFEEEDEVLAEAGADEDEDDDLYEDAADTDDEAEEFEEGIFDEADEEDAEEDVLDEADDDDAFEADADAGDDEDEDYEEEDAYVPVAPVRARRSYLSLDSPVVDAPSIGAKTAAHLNRAGIETVGDLLICDPELTAEYLDVRYITLDAIETWQMQANLMIEVPGLRVHDAQLLVGAGITSRDDLACASAATISELATEFIQTPEGGRILRDGQRFDEEEVEDWIEMAREAA